MSSPPQAAPGATLYVTGIGMPAATAVQVVAQIPSIPDGVLIGLATTNGNGQLRLISPLPDMPAGPATLMAVATTSLAATLFTVSAPLTFAPDVLSGPPGLAVGFRVD